MIRKSIFIATALFAAHSLVIVKLTPDTWITRHQWQYNNLVAQKFIYASDVRENVIVGTSLSLRMLKRDTNYYVLSFAGLSSLDGMKILTSQKGHMPKRVYVETNMLLQEETVSFTSSLCNPFLYYARQYFPGLREGRQPIDWIAYLLTGVISRVTNEATIDNDTDTEKARLALSEANMARLEKTFSKEADFRRNFTALADYVKQLEARGVEVIFFEMPLNPRFCDAPLPVSLRNELDSKFPRDQYQRIEVPDCSTYTTTDGVHLTDDEIRRYEKYFLERVSQ